MPESNNAVDAVAIKSSSIHRDVLDDFRFGRGNRH